MSERNIIHGGFSIERRYDFTPEIVFAAWSDPAAKYRWFANVDRFGKVEYALDFRVGGHETASGIAPDGRRFTNDTRIHDIVANARLVFSYRMTLGGVPISASLTTVTVEADGPGTRVTYAEQGAFLDGYDGVADREGGCAWMLGRLGKELLRVSGSS